MTDREQLCKFLVNAKKETYASGKDTNKKIEQDGSTSLFYTEGDWIYHDNYFGGEPYGGREVVLFKNKPVYIMTYYGYIKEFISDFTPIYTFLQHALSLIPEQHPYRGPQEYKEDKLAYSNIWTGEIDNFSGEEIIIQEGEEIYKAKYMGCFVNQNT